MSDSVLIAVSCGGGLSCTVTAFLRDDGTIWVGSTMFLSARTSDAQVDESVRDTFHQVVPSLHALVDLVRERYKVNATDT